MLTLRRVLLFVPLLAGIPTDALAQSAYAGVTNKTLPNGLEVIVLRNPVIPTVNLQLVLRAGASIQTAPDLQGIPHLLEHMLFRSGDEGSEFEREAARIDASSNGATGPESVAYYMSFPSRHLERGLEILSNLVRKPDFSNKGIETEANVVQGELERNASEPMRTLRFSSDMLLWPGRGWERKNAGGNIIAVKAAKSSTLNAVHKKFYVPNNAALIVAGDVHDTTVFRLAERIYGGWKRGPDPFADVPPPDIDPLPRIERRIITREVASATILVRWHGPSVGADREGTFAADVFSSLVNQPLSGTQRRLVDTGILESVQLRYSTLNHVGPIELVATAPGDRVLEAIRALGEELPRLVRPDYYSDDDLRLARKFEHASEHYLFESSSSAAGLLADFWSSADLGYFREYGGGLDRQSRPSIDAYVQRYLKGKPMVVAVLVPEHGWAKIAAPLQSALGAWRIP